MRKILFGILAIMMAITTMCVMTSCGGDDSGSTGSGSGSGSSESGIFRKWNILLAMGEDAAGWIGSKPTITINSNGTYSTKDFNKLSSGTWTTCTDPEFKEADASWNPAVSKYFIFKDNNNSKYYVIVNDQDDRENMDLLLYVKEDGKYWPTIGFTCI